MSAEDTELTCLSDGWTPARLRGALASAEKENADLRATAKAHADQLAAARDGLHHAEVRLQALCSTCHRPREAQEGVFCSNAFHLAPRPWPTTPEEAADRAVGYCRHVTASRSHDWACAVCIAYWIRFLEPVKRRAFPLHNHERGGPIMARCPGCEAVKALLEGKPAAATQSPNEWRALREFRNEVRSLLIDGRGPGGGFYTEDQRLAAAVSLLQIGWGNPK